MADTRELKFLPQCFRPCVPDHSLGYVHTLKEVELVISSLERDTCVKFSVYKTQPASFGKVNITSTSDLSRHKLLWDEKKDVIICRIPFDGYPFIITGKKVYDCHLGPKRKPHKKMAPTQVPMEDHVYEVPNTKRMRISHTKKLDCPAKIVVREIIKFHNIQISHEDLTQKDKVDQYSAFMRKNIAEGQASYERVFFMSLPTATDHKNHDVGEAANLRFQINPAISTEIQLRVSEVVKGMAGRNIPEEGQTTSGQVENTSTNNDGGGNTTALALPQPSTSSKTAIKCQETLKKLTSLTYIVKDEAAMSSLLKSLRNNLSRFEKFVPNELAKHLPPFFIPCLPGGSLGFVHSPEEVELVIAALEHSSGVKYAVYKSTPMSFGKKEGPTQADLDKHKLFWEDRKDVIACRVPFDGYPFMVVGKKVYECHFGPDRKKLQKEKRRSAQQIQMENYVPKPGEKRKRTRFQHTKKLDCPARLIVREIIKFHDFKIKQVELAKKKKLDWYSTCTRKNIGDDSAIYERLFFMHLPTVSDHQYHAVGEAEELPLNTNPELSSEMRSEIKASASENVKDQGKKTTSQNTQTVYDQEEISPPDNNTSQTNAQTVFQEIISNAGKNTTENMQTPIHELNSYAESSVTQNTNTVSLEVTPQAVGSITQNTQSHALDVIRNIPIPQNTQIVTPEIIAHIQSNTAQNLPTGVALEVNPAQHQHDHIVIYETEPINNDPNSHNIRIYETQPVNDAQNSHNVQIYEGQHVSNVSNQHSVIYGNQLVNNSQIPITVGYGNQPVVDNTTCLDISQSTWQTVETGNILASNANQSRIELSYETNDMVPHPVAIGVGPGGDMSAPQ